MWATCYSVGLAQAYPNKTSYYSISIGNNLYLLPATDKYANLSPPDFFVLQQRTQLRLIYKKNVISTKAVKKGAALCKNARVEKVVKERWWPRWL